MKRPGTIRAFLRGGAEGLLFIGAVGAIAFFAFAIGG